MKRVIVIGLGIFGFNIVKELSESGFEVIAIDKNKEAVQKIKDFATKAIVADGTDKEIMAVIGIQEDDTVIVSFGEDLAAATLTTLHLKQMKVKQVIVKDRKVNVQPVVRECRHVIIEPAVQINYGVHAVAL